MEVIHYLIFLLFSIVYLFSYFYFISSKPTTHGFPTYPLLGSAPSLISSSTATASSTGPPESSPAAPTTPLSSTAPKKFAANPQIVEYMLKSNFDNFPKGTRFRALLQDFLGTSIFNTEGERWRIHWKTSSYWFNTKFLRNFLMENIRTGSNIFGSPGRTG